MIKSKKDYLAYIEDDESAWGSAAKSILLKPEGYVLVRKLRRVEFFKNCGPRLLYKFSLYFYLKYCRKLRVVICPNCFGSGLYIPHPINIVVNSQARIGKRCKIQQGVTIGQSGSLQNSPHLGDDVYVGANAVLIGDIQIANGVVVGANAVVCRNIDEENTTWGGVPALKISNKGSQSFLPSQMGKGSDK